MEIGTAHAPPTLARLLRRCAGRVRDDPASASHVLAALGSFAAWRARIARMRRHRPGKPLVAISLVEHLGDIVEAEPIARHARRLHPDASILWFVRPPYAEIVRTYRSVDRCAPLPCLTTWILLRASGLFDAAFDLHINGRPCPRCRIALEKAGPGAEVTLRNYYDYGSLLASQCACAGLPALTDTPRLVLDESHGERVRALALPSPYVAFHARSNETERDWRADGWTALLAHLRERWAMPAVEVGLASIVPDAPRSLRIDLCGRLSILETAAVLRSAALFVGVDSGPAHLANAAGVPGLVLMGRWRNFVGHMPFSGRYARERAASILRASGPAHELPVDDVVRALDRRLAQVLAPAVARDAGRHAPELGPENGCPSGTIAARRAR